MILLKSLRLIILLVILFGAGLYGLKLVTQPEPTLPINRVSGVDYTVTPIELHIPERIQRLPELAIQASSVILINVDNGNILYERNNDQSFPVASMSKMMTELLVLEAIQQQKVTWNQTVEVSNYAYTISNSPGFSSVHLQKGQTYTIRELFEAMAIHSANGAAIALAEAVAGSEKDFVLQMNQKAEEMGFEHTQYVNSTGLNNKDLGTFYSVGAETDSNRMSAQEVAMLARHLIQSFPTILDVIDASTYTMGQQTFTNTNWMLPTLNVQNLGYEGVDGLKTGFTDEAGYCFAGTVERQGERFVSVVMGTSTKTERFSETKRLYEAAFGR
ncbi:D-alanyl-D-alanine carboxypeptidase family protein [Aquibacillus rhizosphaerae]|uniref:D-alanyl-D-alanine carboxypeptidase family protein n=1 Tax=Aquibacillus rhizosphaerae TaxID=3051431 RepID=A0ABT7LBK0_9BACI|nr:D-alanyl-D-alanine carboxypeptidase family protein [Aquibacillus sp. LR5S19]MDL4843240.1 D-alanyl-D-alanine carboxypeptidase family protein [Aquibacillus sp. LR5S19]